MKKYIVAIFAAGLLTAGCNKSFLNEVATNQVASESYFNNYEQANTVLGGVYRQLQSVYEFQIFVAWGVNSTDEVTAPTWAGVRRELHVYNVQSNNSVVLNMWRNLYTGIFRANQVIDRVTAMSESQIKELQKNRLIGEAKFLRSLLYFQLVKMYGDVPLVTKEITKEADVPTTRIPVADVYKQIIEDLQFAKQHTQTTLMSGVTTKGAATALLGRVYLQMTGWPLNDKSKFDLAAKELKEVIDNPLYGLATNYSDVFSEFKEITADVLKENIFVVKFDGPGKGMGGQMGSYMGPSGPDADGGAFNTAYVNDSRVALYDTTKDIRFFQNIATRNPTNGAPRGRFNWQPMKWVKPQKYLFGTVPAYGYDSPIDFALIRFSDVLLMYAEALNGKHDGPTQEALDAINRVNQRAKKPGSTGLPLYTQSMGMTKERFVDTLLKNRYLELNFEGLRKDDLIRTDRLFTYLRGLRDERFDNASLGKPGNIQDHHRLWPIPISEIQVSKMPQNTGY